MGRARGEQFGHAAGAGADIEQRPDRRDAQRRLQRVLDRTVGGMELAQAVPLRGMAGKIGLRGGFPAGADRGEMAAVLGTAGGELGIVAFGSGKQARGGGAHRRGGPLGDARPQEHPAAFLAPFGETGVAQDAHVARDARLALPEHLGKLADGELHRAEQAHDAQPGRVGQRAQEGIDPHSRAI